MKKIVYLSSALLLCASLFSCVDSRHEHRQRGDKEADGGSLSAVLDDTEVENDVFNDVGLTKKDGQIVFKFYLERSGSMVAYDGRSTSGDFKDAIVSLLNSIPESQDDVNMLYVVNSGVYSYNKSFRDFAKSEDIFGDTRQLGDPRYTDFSCIFDSLIHRTGVNEISILASDLIYSTSSMSSISVEKILKEAKNLTMMSFKGNSDKDVLLIKLLSDYHGKYYPYNSVSRGVNYHGNRPYYLLMIANHDVMEQIVHDKKYESFRNFEVLPGYQDYYLFAGENSTLNEFSLIPNDRNGKGTKYRVGRGQVKSIHRISDIKANKNGKAYLVVALDMSLIFMSEDMKCNPNSYVVESKSNFVIEEIKKVSKSTKTSEFNRFGGNATHLMILSAESNDIKRIDDIHVRMPNRLPHWIAESSSIDDSNINDKDFSETTFALKELCEGIYNAYYPSTEDPAYMDFTIEVAK